VCVCVCVCVRARACVCVFLLFIHVMSTVASVVNVVGPTYADRSQWAPTAVYNTLDVDFSLLNKYTMFVQFGQLDVYVNKNVNSQADWESKSENWFMQISSVGNVHILYLISPLGLRLKLDLCFAAVSFLFF